MKMAGVRGGGSGPAAPNRSQAALMTWLLQGDPSIRWRVLTDLAATPQAQVEAERARVAVAGWGARLLAAQSADGRWADGLYSPKWTSTTYTLLLLHWLGLPRGNPQAVAGCRQVWDGARFLNGGLTLHQEHPPARDVHHGDARLAGILLRLPRRPVDPAVQWLCEQQLADGGWNCESLRSGSRHGSFNTSISALDALLQYQHAGGGVPVSASMEAGRALLP
jgi:hypothetical protein